MRVVISGGTGFIGRALGRSLAERGDDVVILTRGSHASMCPRPREFCRGAGKVELVAWTPEAEGPWFSAIDGADAVVHLAGASVVEGRWTDERKAELRASRITSTKLIAEAIRTANKKPSVLVSGSAVGIYGMKTGDRVLTETDPAGDDFLAKLVVDWEAASRDAPTRVVNPRIGIVLGKRGGVLAKMLPAFKAFVGGPVGDGTQYVPWIHIADAARALQHAIDDPSYAGAYNVTSPQPVTMEELSNGIAKALARPSVFRVPAFAVRLAMGEAAGAVLTGQRAIPKRLVDGGFAFLFPELDSALADLLGG